MDDIETLKLLKSTIATWAFTLGRFIALGLEVQKETQDLINTLDKLEQELEENLIQTKKKLKIS